MKNKTYKIGFCCGVFDLGHLGHINFLKEAQSKCDILTIGIVTDKAVKEKKGNDRPILNLQERYNWLIAMDYNQCNIYNQDTFNPSLNISCIQPDIFIKGEDQHHISENKANELNIPIIYLKRTKGISTSDIIKRIK